jgi:hypothetical protein
MGEICLTCVQLNGIIKNICTYYGAYLTTSFAVYMPNDLQKPKREQAFISQPTLDR